MNVHLLLLLINILRYNKVLNKRIKYLKDSIINPQSLNLNQKLKNIILINFLFLNNQIRFLKMPMEIILNMYHNFKLINLHLIDCIVNTKELKRRKRLKKIKFLAAFHLNHKQIIIRNELLYIIRFLLLFILSYFNYIINYC